MLLAIGLFAFGMDSLAFQDLQRKTDWRHALTPRVGARDAAQWVGPGADTISISGSAHAELMDGRASIDQLREMGGSGEAWQLLDGAGRVYGSYVITSIDERANLFFPDGTPMRIDFGIELLAVDTPSAA